MNEKEFCYWLKGFFELTDADSVDATQVAMIKEHLDLVFTKVTKTKKELLQEVAYPAIQTPFVPPPGYVPGYVDPDSGNTYCCSDMHTVTAWADGTPVSDLFDSFTHTADI